VELSIKNPNPELADYSKTITPPYVYTTYPGQFDNGCIASIQWNVQDSYIISSGNLPVVEVSFSYPSGESTNLSQLKR